MIPCIISIFKKIGGPRYGLSLWMFHGHLKTFSTYKGIKTLDEFPSWPKYLERLFSWPNPDCTRRWRPTLHDKASWNPFWTLCLLFPNLFSSAASCLPSSFPGPHLSNHPSASLIWLSRFHVTPTLHSTLSIPREFFFFLKLKILPLSITSFRIFTVICPPYTS